METAWEARWNGSRSVYSRTAVFACMFSIGSDPHPSQSTPGDLSGPTEDELGDRDK